MFHALDLVTCVDDAAEALVLLLRYLTTAPLLCLSCVYAKHGAYLRRFMKRAQPTAQYFQLPHTCLV